MSASRLERVDEFLRCGRPKAQHDVSRRYRQQARLTAGSDDFHRSPQSEDALQLRCGSGIDHTGHRYEKQRVMDQASTYRYSRRMPYWAAVLGSILLVMALSLTGTTTTTAQRMICVPVNFVLALGTVCAVLYFNRYRVVLDGDRVSVGTSATKSFILADVTALACRTFFAGFCWM
jgi:hypothetical protein